MRIKRKIAIGKNQSRSFDAIVDSIDKEKKTLELSFSSELPYPRYFGTEVLEVISHDEGDMDMARLNNKCAVLFNHNFDNLIGVVEKAWIDGKVGKAVIRLSSTAWQYATMVEEGILTKVSFAYEIRDMVKVGEQDGIPIVKCKTNPYEISLVSVPADDSVGVMSKKKEIDEEEQVEVDFEDDETEEEKSKREAEENKPADTTEPAPTEPVAPTEPTEEEKQKALDDAEEEKEELEKKRIKSILDSGKRFKEMELSFDYIDNGKSLAEFQIAVIEKMSKQ